MPNYTANLNLSKPIPSEDVADIEVINANMEKIDKWSEEIDIKTALLTEQEVIEIIQTKREV
ncbi:hypothetical protein [Cetobacterium sp.]